MTTAGPVAAEATGDPVPSPAAREEGRAHALRRFPWLAAVAFALTTFALLPQPLLGQRTFGAVDMLEQSTPYRELLGRPAHVASWLQTDQVEGFPEKVSFWEDLRHGQFQSWTRRVAAGTPTGVFPFNATLSPFSIGFAFLPAWYALGLSAALALVVCQVGTYLLLRRLGVRAAVAVLGAVAYAFAGANVVNLHRVTAPFVLPLLLWSVDRLVDRPTWPRAAAMGCLVAWMWLEGFPFVFVVCLGVALAWGLWRAGGRWVQERRSASSASARAGPGRPVAFMAVGAAWGLAIAAISLAPTLYEISRRGTLGLRDFATYHLPLPQLVGVFEGRALGRWQEHLWSGVPFATEADTTVGLIVAVGVLVACVTAVRRRLLLTDAGRAALVFWLVVGGVTTVIVFAGGPLLTLVSHVPGLAHNRLPRARFLIPLAAAVVAAVGLDALLGARDGAERRLPAERLAPALALVGGAGLCLVAGYRWLDLGHRLGTLHELRGPIAVDAAVTAAAVALLVVAWRRRRLPAALALGVVALLWVQLAWPVRELTPAAPVSDFYRTTSAHRAMRDRLADRYRFVGSGLFTFYSGSSQLHGLDDLRGFALRTPASRNLVLAASPVAFDRDQLKIVLDAQEWDMGSPVLDDLAVRYFAMSSYESPLGLLRRVDPAFDRWLPSTDPGLAAEPLRAGGPVVGIALPLRAAPSCSGRPLTVRLHSGGRSLGVASRPAYDAEGDFTHFAIDGAGLAPGQPYGVTVDPPGVGCRVDVGVLPAGAPVLPPGAAGPRVPVPATREFGPDPAVPVRLVSATAGWVYERPTAGPLVSAHSRWRAFADQRSLLDWLAHRPASEADVAAYVGPEASEPGVPGAEATVGGVRWHEQSVAFGVDSEARSLAVVAQNADPGWSASVDGRAATLVPVDGALQGVFVPPGHHRVVLHYREPVLLPSLAVTAAALLAAVLVGLAPLLSRRGKARRSAQTAKPAATAAKAGSSSQAGTGGRHPSAKR